MTIMDAAQTLAVKLGPPAYHSVYIATTVDPETKEFIREIHVAVRNQYKNKINVPTLHDGFPVKQVPWPKGD